MWSSKGIWPGADGSGAVDDQGVHAFIVPLRDEAGNILPGVEIRDCGYKVPLFGFDGVRKILLSRGISLG